MIIGVDFDNTIVDYFGLFHRIALQKGWIPSSVEQSKISVKKFFIIPLNSPGFSSWTKTFDWEKGEVHNSIEHEHKKSL